MSDILARAKRAIPGITEIDEAIARAEKLKRAVADAAIPVIDLTAEICDGDVEPADLLRRVAEIEAAKSNAVRAAWMSNEAIKALTNQRENVVREGTNDALAVVRDEVERIHREAGDVFATLGLVDSPAAAINRGVVEEWKRAGELVSELRAARTAQMKLTAGPAQAANVEMYGWVRGLDVLDAVHRQVNTSPDGRPIPPLFPLRDFRPEVNLDYLRWFASLPLAGEFGVWVPTVEEFAQEQEDRATRVNVRNDLRYSPPINADALEALKRRAGGEWVFDGIRSDGTQTMKFVVNEETVSHVLSGMNK
ncbi:hypothetical protein [Pseudonocardia sp. T1-2H]|uniref:hypothetical protein n=1 Tax=Pseudonocardia sp. T1-2H TaxID=3128899 RepID=UPI0031014A1E